MTGHSEETPGCRTLPPGPPRAPGVGAADAGRRAGERYPDIRTAGGPVFGVAEEGGDGRWRLHAHVTAAAPREARDVLGAHVRLLAFGAHAAGDAPRREACLRAAGLLEREPLDAVTVAGTRYRVVRAERFWRTGPDGPEPPRATDPSGARLEHDPAGGFLLAPAAGPCGGPAAELLAAGPPLPGHPGGALLPASYMTVERSGPGWPPHDAGTAFTPAGARAGLAAYLRVLAPWQLRLDPAARAAHAAAADRLERERADELTVCGRHFRIVRVERLVRLGPDGPEPPRPGDAAAAPERGPTGGRPHRPEADGAGPCLRELLHAERGRRAGRGTGGRPWGA